MKKKVIIIINYFRCFCQLWWTKSGLCSQCTKYEQLYPMSFWINEQPAMALLRLPIYLNIMYPGQTYSIGVEVTGDHERGYGFQAIAQSGDNVAGEISLNSNSSMLK